MDLVGPLPKSSPRFQYIPILMDYRTLFPETIPLQNTTARTIATELLKVFAQVRPPKEIFTDQVCMLLGIKKL